MTVKETRAQSDCSVPIVIKRILMRKRTHWQVLQKVKLSFLIEKMHNTAAENK